MKTQGNYKAGIVLIVFSIIVIGVGLTFAIVIPLSIPNSPGIIPFVVPFIFTFLFFSIPLVMGIVMVVRGKKSASVKKLGRKTSCEVYNIIRVKNGYQMVVDYCGDSGEHYKHALYIGQRDALLLKAGMRIECYVYQEDCYVDESNIVTVDDGFGE